MQFIKSSVSAILIGFASLSHAVVNVAKVNGITVAGTGVAGVDPWRPD